MMSNEHTKAEFVVSSNLFELLLNLTFFIEVFFEALFKQLCASIKSVNFKRHAAHM